MYNPADRITNIVFFVEFHPKLRRVSTQITGNIIRFIVGTNKSILRVNPRIVRYLSFNNRKPLSFKTPKLISS